MLDRFFLAIVALVATSGAVAQSDWIRSRAAQAADLEFPTEAKTLGFFSAVENSIFKPEGSGPFPAVVFFHTCGGIDHSRNRYWMEAALARGYAVLILDSLGPRGLKTVCDVTPLSDKQGVNLIRGLKDAMDALAHLRKLPFIVGDRLALVGFSWGAMAGLYASGKAYAGSFSARRYAAVASFYPYCGPYLQIDTDRPLLVLMGEADDETPPATCLGGLQTLKAIGAPVDWHVYPGATHSWDTFREVVKTTNRGLTVRYVPNSKVRDESAARLFAFLDQHLRQ